MQIIVDEPKEKRQFVRFPYRQPVMISKGEWVAGEGSLSGDVSEGGIRLTVNEIIPVGTTLDLEVFLPDESKITAVKGRVARVNLIPYSDRFQIGIQFDPESNSSKLEILRTLNFHPQTI